MSTYNEERDIRAALDAALAQTVPVDVTVVDGGSSDDTVSIMRARAADDARLHVIADGVRRTLPDALNLALAQTQRPFVAKVDARTVVAEDFVERALEVFDEEENANVACVGGQPDQVGTTAFGRGVACARRSRYGVGASGYADARTRAEVASVQCGIYRRRALDVVGGFDPSMQFGEDEELNWRLREAGYRILRDATIRLTYSTRTSWRAAFRQYRNYGRARIAVAVKHPAFLRPHHLAPSAALAGLTALAVAAPFSSGARMAFVGAVGAYVAGSAIAALTTTRDAATAACTFAAFTALHAGYGIGLAEASARRGAHFVLGAKA